MATKAIRRQSSYTGTSDNRKAMAIYAVPDIALDPAHVLTYETETHKNTVMTRVLCGCGRFVSSWWAAPERARLAGAAHRYAMTFPVVPDGPRRHAEEPVILAHGVCYVHDVERPCPCIRGCVWCTGCLCSCDCMTRY